MAHSCAQCGKQLFNAPEKNRGDWVIHCERCGANNVVTPTLEVLGYRDVQGPREA